MDTCQAAHNKMYNPLRGSEGDEWITEVYTKENDMWLCVLTHLTPVKK